MKKTVVSLALIAALLTACGNIEIHFADPEDVQNAVEIFGSRASVQSPTTQQRTIGSSQEAVKLIGTKLIAENELDTNPEPPNEGGSSSAEEQEVSAVPTSDSESESTIVSTQLPKSQPDPLLAPTTSLAYGAIPFELAAGTGAWWGIDETDSAYWAEQKNINAIQAAGNLPGLTMDDGLSAIADVRCESFVAGGPFDHSGMVTQSEILAAGPLRSASEACAAWQGSEVHYANIMRTDITRMGVGCWFCQVDGNQYAFWTVTFE